MPYILLITTKNTIENDPWVLPNDYDNNQKILAYNLFIKTLPGFISMDTKFSKDMLTLTKKIYFNSIENAESAFNILFSKNPPEVVAAARHPVSDNISTIKSIVND